LPLITQRKTNGTCMLRKFRTSIQSGLRSCIFMKHDYVFVVYCLQWWLQIYMYMYYIVS